MILARFFIGKISCNIDGKQCRFVDENRIVKVKNKTYQVQ